jgi:hypothetical protein
MSIKFENRNGGNIRLENRFSNGNISMLNKIISPEIEILTNGLLVNLNAGDTNSYVGGGATWTNLVDNTNYTISNGTFDSEDGGSIVFNGSSTFVSIGTPLSSGTNYTKESWVKASVVTGSRNILSSASNVFWISAGTLYGGVDNSYQLVSSSSFPVDVWTHVVLTFNDTTNTMTMYINGSQVAQNTSVTQSYIGENLRIGSHFFGGSPVSFWNGNISQVRVYNIELSSTEVLQNYNATKNVFGL